MVFTPIDFASWPRREVFWYFSNMAPTGYSLSFDVDVSSLRPLLKDRGYRFFPAYLWLVTRNLNRQVEFKVAKKDSVLGFYDTLTPLYASFHSDDHTFSLMYTEFSSSFGEFHERYLENQALYGSRHGVLSQPGTPPGNAYTVSTLPWVGFSHFAIHSFENKPYFFPSVESGKFVEKNGRIFMPLSLTCHHATTDGWHVSQFISDLENDIRGFEAYF